LTGGYDYLKFSVTRLRVLVHCCTKIIYLYLLTGRGYGNKLLNKSTMPKQNSIYKNLDSIHNSSNVIDTLCEIDRIFDRMDVYAYDNWLYGEIVDGPFIERHWVELTLMYPNKMMPDPDAAMRLIKSGCKVKMGKDKFETFVKVKGPNDIIITKEGDHIPRIEYKSVWLVNIRMPKQLLNITEDLKDAEDIDADSVETAYDEELNTLDPLQDDKVQA